MHAEARRRRPQLDRCSPVLRVPPPAFPLPCRLYAVALTGSQLPLLAPGPSPPHRSTLMASEADRQEMATGFGLLRDLTDKACFICGGLEVVLQDSSVAATLG